MEEGVAAAANVLREASYAVAFTGAGISTPSGIPDFRSPGTGLWHQVRPALVASTWTLRLRPQVFYEWMRPLAHRILEAEPNAAHRALVELEEAGRLNAVITQNIDGLHQTAGSRRVLELHGHTRTASCLGCGRTVDTAPIIETFLMGDVPHCAWCDGVLRPDVVLLGEMLPADVFAAAQVECERCDLLLVVGSSLEVTPAAELPLVALRAGADLVIVNLQPTPLDARASVFIRHDVATILPAITEEVLGGP
jgi:NAD-dependent deacetylase